jgi:hypothetical protein
LIRIRFVYVGGQFFVEPSTGLFHKLQFRKNHSFTVKTKIREKCESTSLYSAQILHNQIVVCFDTHKESIEHVVQTFYKTPTNIKILLRQTYCEVVRLIPWGNRCKYADCNPKFRNSNCKCSKWFRHYPEACSSICNGLINCLEYK